METFSALLALCAGNLPVTCEFPHKGQWRGVLMISLIYAWINGWLNNREAGDLRIHLAHYGVTVMITFNKPHGYLGFAYSREPRDENWTTSIVVHRIPTNEYLLCQWFLALCESKWSITINDCAGMQTSQNGYHRDMWLQGTIVMLRLFRDTVTSSYGADNVT